MRVAVVAPDYGRLWDERQIIVRRLAGALACSTEVDDLLPGIHREVAHDGAARTFRFPATLPDTTRRRAWRKAMLGEHDHDDRGPQCRCPGVTASLGPLPQFAEDEIVRAEGGDSDELYQHLSTSSYDLVVLVGIDSPACSFGCRHIPRDTRIVLVPATMDDRALLFRTHDEAFERAERIVVWSEMERSVIAARSPNPERVTTLDFVIGVNSLATTTEPHDFERQAYVVVAGDWSRVPSVDRLERFGLRLEEIDPRLRLRLVGPGAEHLGPIGVRLTTSRLDVWRWSSRALCLFEPRRRLLLGLPALETMLFGVPAVVHADGGAIREHVENGDGGLWYRTDDEFFAVVQALLDDDLRQALGEQGRRYAEEFTDTEQFIKAVTEALIP
jgi:hypothetical protein